MYEQIKTKENYDKLLASGMFWELHPELTGDWIEDKAIIYSHDCFENDNRFAKTHIQYKEYCKSDFQSGAEFMQKEYEEKLRWIPVEEKLPEKIQKEPTVSAVVQVRTKNFSEPFCAYYNHLYEVWLPYPYGQNSPIVGIAEWRYFL